MEDRAQSIFFIAVERPPEQWPGLLEEACGDDASLRRRVDELLHAHNVMGHICGGGEAAVSDDTRAIAERPGTIVGPYRLLEQIGEGGFGVVFIAEQSQPVRRNVAIKVLKPGMDSRQVVARFEAERQALALMNHPNIAQVFDGGETQLGRPYFVMELVRGVPITDFCDQNQVPVRERLSLFVRVCQAVQHAHQKGVIHRDLKPSNILITMRDAMPVVKVIDFGIAKASGQQLTEKTLITHWAQMIGTPAYMSPEQVQMSSLDVDTRSDIYALGVILYELLTGTTPVERQRLRSAGYDEIRRIIREEEPPAPSTRISELRSRRTLGAIPEPGRPVLGTDDAQGLCKPSMPSGAKCSGDGTRSESATTTVDVISTNRSSDPDSLRRLLSGELDWIVMKCLEKDRDRRYETTSALALDIERYLRDEPVLACPPSAAYRFRKFAQRNRGALLTTALLAAALILGTITSSWLAIRAIRAESLAQERLEAEKIAVQRAEAQQRAAERARSDAVLNFQRGRDAVDQMLARALEARLVYLPQTEPLRRDILQDALKFYNGFLEEHSEDRATRQQTALAYRYVGAVHNHLGQYLDAERAYRKAIEMLEEIGNVSPLEPHLRAALRDIHIEFTATLGVLGKADEGLKHLQQAVDVAQKLWEDFPQDTTHREHLVGARINLAFSLIARQPHEAEQIFRQNLALAETCPNLEWIHRGLGDLFMADRRFQEAEEEYRQAVKYVEQEVAESPAGNWIPAGLAHDLLQLASALVANARDPEADGHLRRAIQIYEKLASDFPAGPHFRHGLARAYMDHAGALKKLDCTAEAEQAYRRAVELLEKLAADFPAIPMYQQFAFDQRLGLGQLLAQVGRLQEAQQIYRDAGRDAPISNIATQFNRWRGLVRAHIELARLLESSGRTTEAETAFQNAIAILEKLDSEHGANPEFRRDVAHSHAEGASLLRFANRHAEAEKFYLRALAHFETLASESHQSRDACEELAATQFALADFLRWAPDRLEHSEKYFRLALQQYERLANDFSNVLAYRIALADCRERLASVLQFQGRIGEAEQNLREVLDSTERLAAECANDCTVRMTLAMGSRHWGETVQKKREFSAIEVERAFRRAEGILEKLAADFPDQTWYRVEWGVTCQALVALLAHNLNQPQAAEEFYHRNVAIFEKLIAQSPRDPFYRGLLAHAHREWALGLQDVGRKEQAKEILALAIDNFARAIELGSKDLWNVWYPQALLELSTGRTNDYRLLCETLLERFGHFDPPEFWVIWICKLGPDAVADLDPPVRLAEKLSARQPRNFDLIGILGETLYRKGDLDAAIQKLEASIQGTPGWHGVVWRQLFLAMAYHRRGDTEHAQQLVHEAAEWSDRNNRAELPEDADLREPLPWQMRMGLQLLRQETEMLLGSHHPSPSPLRRGER